MASLIMDNAADKMARYNEEGLHYNLVANEIYKIRHEIRNPLDKYYLPYIIAGLISFDMGRMMGSNKYSYNDNAFASRLHAKLEQIEANGSPILNVDILSTDSYVYKSSIKYVYDVLSASGPGALHENKTKSFHVGATKILHFINPELFIIVDSNAARAFHRAWSLPFKNTTRPGFSADLYLLCLSKARADIISYGPDQFRALDPDIPLTRIYDKLLFITGSSEQ